MTALSYAFLTIAVVLGVALLVTRRRHIEALGQEGTVDPPETTASDDPDRTQRLETAAKLAPLGMVILDSTGNRVFENPAATAYTSNTPADSIVGVRLRDLFAEAADFDEPIEQEIELFSPIPRTLLLRATPLMENDRRVGTAAFIEDLTTTSRIDSMRSDFIANASHELKTPLGALRLLAEALATTNDDEVRHDLAARIQNEAGRMTRLVEDILDLTLIEEAEHLEQPVDLCSVVDAAADQTNLLSNATGIGVRTSCSPVVVLGDERRLVSAVANLIENAINYTAAKALDQPHPIEVRAHHSGDKAVVEVEDHGIGIAQRHQERIFERFYRVDRGRSRDRGGTGLGLAIVSHIVQNHRGTIKVSSTPGEGAKFRIELPAAEE